MQKTQEMLVHSLGQEDPLEEGMATHSSILTWRIPQREEHGGLQSISSQRVGHNWSDQAHTHIFQMLEGVPDLPVAPQDEAGLTKTFQTWPRGWLHIP